MRIKIRQEGKKRVRNFREVWVRTLRGLGFLEEDPSRDLGVIGEIREEGNLIYLEAPDLPQEAVEVLKGYYGEDKVCIGPESSEVFVVMKTKDPEEILKEVKRIHEEFESKVSPEELFSIGLKEAIEKRLDYFSSGDGGKIMLFGEDEDTLEILVDENFYATHDWIRENYQVIREYSV